MSGLYAADGSMNVTVVSGLSFTGLYAADGSINVIISPGSSFVGAYHPCGAWYVTVSPGTLVPIRAPDGSLYVQTSPYAGNSGKKVTVVSGSLNQAIGGYKIGDAGMAGTIYENHILSWGDDFNSALDIVGPSTPKGKYFVQKSYSAGPRGNTTTLGLSYDTDPLHTGYQDSNRGVPIGYTNMSQSGSILKLGARKATSGEQAGMSPTDPSINSGVRPLLSSMMHTDGTVGFYVGSDASVIVEARLKYVGNGQLGWHPDFWVQSANPMSCFVTGSFDSLNACEGNSAQGNSSDLHIVNGSVTGVIEGSVFSNLYDGNFHLVSMVLINGGSWFVYIDGVLKTTLTTDANSFSLPMYIIATSHVANFSWFSETYSAAAWNTTGASLQIDYIRVWRPSAAVHIKPLLTIPDLLVSYTGTGSIVLPSAASLWSTTPDAEYVQAVPCESNEPGMGVETIYQQFPTGVTYNSGTRTINVDFSAGTGNAGVIHGTVKGWKTGGSMTYEPVRFTIIRGPATSTVLISAANGTPLSIDAYPQVDVGIATPKAIAVSGLATGLSYNSTNNLITGTPSGLVSDSPLATVTCTNSQGQSGIASLVASLGPTLILAQNWDGVTAPTLPAGWTAVGASGLMTTSIVVANSSPNSIKVPPVNANAFLLSPSQDTNSGNVSVSSNVYITNATSANTIGVIARAANLTPTNFYRGIISRGSGSTFSAAIQKNVSGTTTTLVSLAAGSLFASAAWYNVILTCVGTSLSLAVQRMSDSMWLNSGSAYQSGQTTCLTVTDSSITGAGYYGLYGFSPVSGLDYLDDFSISTA